jgi:LPXTG-site transpeptidase (sortase) family protein
MLQKLKLYLRFHRLHPTRLLLVATGVLLLGYGVAGAMMWHRAVRTDQIDYSKTASRTVATTTDKPDERPVDVSAYRVPKDQPRRIMIPSINVAGAIQKVDVDQSGAIAVPTNVHMAGWFVQSSRPGEQGVSIVDGHVSGVYEKGVFQRLAQARSGEKIEIEFGDYSRKLFEIIRLDTVTPKEASTLQYQQLPGVDSQLTLVTCGGGFDRKTQSYDRRVVVRAKPVRF